MLRFLPILLPLLAGFVMMQFSVWQTRKRLKAQSTELDAPELRPQLAALAEALELPHIPVRVHEIPTINGLADLDGQVYLTRGLLDQMKDGALSADEVTSVIAHELGHVALGHGPRRMRDFAGQNALRIGVGMLFARFLPMIGPWIANHLVALLAAKLSRRDEFEADEYASALLITSGIGVTPQITMFEKLTQMGDARQGSAWMASHPDPHARIKAIEENAAKWM